MPILLFIYFTQFLDKNILSYASIMGFPVSSIGYQPHHETIIVSMITFCDTG